MSKLFTPAETGFLLAVLDNHAEKYPKYSVKQRTSIMKKLEALYG